MARIKIQDCSCLIDVNAHEREEVGKCFECGRPIKGRVYQRKELFSSEVLGGFAGRVNLCEKCKDIPSKTFPKEWLK